MSSFIASLQSFLYSITTNDRYASFDTDHRSSYATARNDALINENTEYYANGNPYQPTTVTTLASYPSSSRQYTPGFRSSQVGNAGEIPLEDYSNGPPAAPVHLSWKRINKWMENNYPELADQINEGATGLDLNEIEADLGNCTLPLDVRESWMLHDGQERGGRPTGAIFGICLMDLESIAEEWSHWKNTSIKLENMLTVRAQKALEQQVPSPATGGSVMFKSRRPRIMVESLDWIQKQSCLPEDTIQTIYAHPGWIPLATDFLGNNIAIDLAPGSKGKWGQVILFGREYDRKYVVAPSWGSFLMTFADDLENGRHLIEDETEEGEFSFRAQNGKIMNYFDVLKTRVEKLHKPKEAEANPYDRPNATFVSSTVASGTPQSRSTNSQKMKGRNLSGHTRTSSLKQKGVSGFMSRANGSDPNTSTSQSSSGRMESPLKKTYTRSDQNDVDVGGEENESEKEELVKGEDEHPIAAGIIKGESVKEIVNGMNDIKI